jgi:hypothetical protein
MSSSNLPAEYWNEYKGVNWHKDGPNGEKNKTGEDMFQHLMNCIDAGVTRAWMPEYMKEEYPSEPWSMGSIDQVMKLPKMPYNPVKFPPKRNLVREPRKNEIRLREGNRPVWEVPGSKYDPTIPFSDVPVKLFADPRLGFMEELKLRDAEKLNRPAQPRMNKLSAIRWIDYFKPILVPEIVHTPTLVPEIVISNPEVALRYESQIEFGRLSTRSPVNQLHIPGERAVRTPSPERARRDNLIHGTFEDIDNAAFARESSHDRRNNDEDWIIDSD